MDIQIQCCCDIQSVENIKNLVNTDQQIMSLLSTVLERCRKEKDNNCLQVPLEDYLERVSYYTAYPKMFIYYLIEGNSLTEQALWKEEDMYDHILLMECLNSCFYAEKKVAKDIELYESLLNFKSIRSENYKLSCITDFKTFKNKLYMWDYVYRKKTNRVSIIMENPKIKFERYNYLNKIRNYRFKGKQIYYVDERQIDTNIVKKYTCIMNDNKQKVFEGFLYFHIITRNGYENGLYTFQDPDKSFPEIFKKWMIDVVLHSIKPSSVIVMAHNVLHGVLPTRPVSRYDSKNEMLQWLRENNIPCDPSMPKPVLYELIEKCTVNTKDFEIDRVFKSCGHDVLRLPKTFSSLTPTTYLWDYVTKNTKLPAEGSTAVSLKQILSDRITNLSTNLWELFADKVIDLEKDIWELDEMTEAFLEAY